LWVQNALQFGISSNEIIEIFVDKYLTIDRTLILHKYINTNHSYDILGARMLWKPKEARILTNFIDQPVNIR
jgi:hypothetical protein